MVGNPMTTGGMNQMDSKSPNLQSSSNQNVQINFGQIFGQMPATIIINNNNYSQRNSMPGK